MPRRVILRPQAEADAYDQARYLLIAERSPQAADRFVADLRAAFEQLTRFPQLGRPWPTRNPELKGMRRLRLSDFPLSLFYRPSPQAVEIVRVLHHGRDLPSELEQ